MKIVVTGATGLIGRSVCRSLANDGHTVVALSRKPEDARGLAASTAYKWDPVVGPPGASLTPSPDSPGGNPRRSIGQGRSRRIRDSAGDQHAEAIRPSPGRTQTS
jgi:uncharacterized protein YbjT (DUF2867 family)